MKILAGVAFGAGKATGWNLCRNGAGGEMGSIRILCTSNVGVLAMPLTAIASHGMPRDPASIIKAETLISHHFCVAAVITCLVATLLIAATIRRNFPALSSLAWCLGCIAALSLAASFVLRWKEQYDLGYGPLLPLIWTYQWILLLGVMLIMVGLFLHRKVKNCVTLIFFLPLVAAGLIAANKIYFIGLYKGGQYSSDPAVDFMYQLNIFQLILQSIAYCALTTAACVSLMAITGTLSVAQEKLPTLTTLYRWNRNAVLSGVVLLWSCLIVEMYLDNYAYGYYWLWEPKASALALISVIFSAWIALNARSGWDSVRAVRKFVIGPIVIVTIHLMAELLLSGI